MRSWGKHSWGRTGEVPNGQVRKLGAKTGRASEEDVGAGSQPEARRRPRGRGSGDNAGDDAWREH